MRAVCHYEFHVTEHRDLGEKGTYRNGYLLNFVLGIRDSFVKAPDGYSRAAVDKIAGNFKETDGSYSQSDAKIRQSLLS